MVEVNNFSVNKEKIKNQYEEVVKKVYKENLSEKGVELPNLIWGDNFTKNGVMITLLSMRDDDGKFVWWHDDDFRKVFKYLNISNWSSNIQCRHLRKQKGWNMLLGSDKHTDGNDKEFKLVNLAEPFGGYISENRSVEGDFNSKKDLKEKYLEECDRTPLTQKKIEDISDFDLGHIDPNKPYSYVNTFPQDPELNRACQDKFHFNKRGIPTKATVNHCIERLKDKIRETEGISINDSLSDVEDEIS